MTQLKRIITVLLILLIAGFHPLKAQSVRGKIIYVHPSQVVKLKFKSAVDNYSFVNRDESRLFNVKLSNNRTFMINSLKQLMRSSNLVITEGGNTHLFILVYKDQLSEGGETFYDFSDLSKNPAGGQQNPAGVKYVSKPKVVTTTTGSNTVAVAGPPPVKNDVVEKKVDSKPVTNTVNTVTTLPVTQTSLKTNNEHTGGTKSAGSTAAPASQKSSQVIAPSALLPDSVRYELFIHHGDSTAWIAKDYRSALKWYDSALRIRPDAPFPKKQIKAVKQLQAQMEAADAIKQRTTRFNNAMLHYKKADALKQEKKYPEAYEEYKQFLQTADTTQLSQYSSSQLFYINEAKDYLVRLKHYLPKPVVNTPPPPVEEKSKKKKKKRRG